jgi:3-oxoacyl-[acyl-carrier protein] reductase
LKGATKIRFDGKAAIVTEGAKGLGRVFAKGLAREGCAVLIVDIDEEGLDKTSEEIREGGGAGNYSEWSESGEDVV